MFLLFLKCFIIGAAKLCSMYNLTDVQTNVPVEQQTLLNL